MPIQTGLDYDLIDFGQGRKLERFGSTLLDRPCPAAEGIPQEFPTRWSQAHARFARLGGQDGQWTVPGNLPAAWPILWKPPEALMSRRSEELLADSLVLMAKLTPFGHVGIFPEQADNWSWIACQVRKIRRQLNRPARVLNLFAYTGGSTLAAALAGAEVTHVDAVKTTVHWARQNAQGCGLADRPIRWLTEDAPRFVQREIRRSRRYDGIILDPPTYGHGPQGRAWKIDLGLPSLLVDCTQLINPPVGFVLLSAHSPGWGPCELAAAMRQTPWGEAGRLQASNAFLVTPAGRKLPCGAAACWEAG